MKTKFKIPRFNVEELEEGKATRFTTTNKKPVKMPINGSYLFEVLDSNGVIWAIFSGIKNEPYITITETLKKVGPGTEFFYGIKNGEPMIKIINEIKSVHKATKSKEIMPWEQESKKLEFGKHNKKGEEIYISPKDKKEEELNTVVSSSKVLTRDETKTIKPEKNYEEQISETKEALIDKVSSEVFGLNVSREFTICCPHCEEMINIGIEINKNKITKDLINNK